MFFCTTPEANCAMRLTAGATTSAIYIAKPEDSGTHRKNAGGCFYEVLPGLGAHRTRHAQILPQPRAHDELHDLSAGPTCGPGVRIRRARERRRDRRGGSGSDGSLAPN